ncbi:methyltransferase [Aliikangiella sp. IMCC44359]|uniref:methyltransferase n=1 Tax=Aliikangiella sp. IMCC44359 TaxID=3459125 RepID=UPI00403B0D02
MRPQLHFPYEYQLDRYPKTADKSLRAWSSADELLITHLTKNSFSNKPNILIINDQFGALTTCLNQFSPQYWSDSYLSCKAIKQNLLTNFTTDVMAYPFNPNRIILKEINNNNADTTINKKALTDKPVFDLVLLRVPKHNSLLEYQLNAIKPLITPHSQIIAAGMCKDIHNSNLKIFENTIGETTTSLATKKARLIFTQYTKSEVSQLSTKSYLLSKEGLTIYGLPGVFSREKLDIGTRVMLNYLPELNANSCAIDLGCGNGILGATLAKRYPSAKIILTDESELAVKSAELTFHKNQLTTGQFFQTDVLENITKKNVTHIVCNPPTSSFQNMDTSTNLKFKELYPF